GVAGPTAATPPVGPSPSTETDATLTANLVRSGRRGGALPGTDRSSCISDLRSWYAQASARAGPGEDGTRRHTSLTGNPRNTRGRVRDFGSGEGCDGGGGGSYLCRLPLTSMKATRPATSAPL